MLSLLALGAALSGAGGRAAYADDDYRLGHGYDVGPFNFAGYGDAVGAVSDNGAKSLSVDDISLFVTGHIGRVFNPFLEAELTNLDVAASGASGPGRADGDIVLERLYDDVYVRDDLTLRLGKMLSPVGEWNEIHAAPLVLTTVRPAVTYRNFSEYTTGVSAIYSDPETNLIDAKLYWQPSGELSERPNTIVVHQYRSVEGAQISVPIGLLDKVGVSFQQSTDIVGVKQSLYGLDYHYTLGKLTLQGEGTYSTISSRPAFRMRDSEWGAYTAGSYALSEEWSVQFWYEGFADRNASSPAHDVLAGIAYRPVSAIVLRIEYLQNLGGPPVNPTGLYTSFSILF